jgi:hypothetical protein
MLRQTSAGKVAPTFSTKYLPSCVFPKTAPVRENQASLERLIGPTPSDSTENRYMQRRQGRVR